MGIGSPKFRHFLNMFLGPKYFIRVVPYSNSSPASKFNLSSPGLEHLSSLYSLLLCLLGLFSLLGQSGPSVPCICAPVSLSQPPFHLHLPPSHSPRILPLLCQSAHGFQTHVMSKEPAGTPTQVLRGWFLPSSYLVCNYLYLLLT